ncbi:hypothetical protein PV326_013470 [Microctonus aethiopoides]|nr:hypothetical protein PV326_013470 [Microctonus aethiopoides]
MFSAQCIPNDPVNFQIDQLAGFSRSPDQNLEKIKATRFSYLSQRNLKNEKIHFFSTVETTPYLLQIDFDFKDSGARSKIVYEMSKVLYELSECPSERLNEINEILMIIKEILYDKISSINLKNNIATIIDNDTTQTMNSCHEPSISKQASLGGDLNAKHQVWGNINANKAG